MSKQSKQTVENKNEMNMQRDTGHTTCQGERE